MERKGNMEKVKIIEESGLFHIYVGNVDFWLNQQELFELFAMILPTVKKGGKNA